MATGIRGASGAALIRAAEAMLRALGGDEIGILFPALAMPDDPSAQLGLVDPGVEEVRFSPVVVRNLPTSNSGPRRRLEFLLAGSAVTDVLSDRDAPSADALFGSALGVLYAGDLLHIEGVATEYFGGVAYLYRVTAVE